MPNSSGDGIRSTSASLRPTEHILFTTERRSSSDGSRKFTTATASGSLSIALLQRSCSPLRHRFGSLAPKSVSPRLKLPKDPYSRRVSMREVPSLRDQEAHSASSHTQPTPLRPFPRIPPLSPRHPLGNGPALQRDSTLVGIGR